MEFNNELLQSINDNDPKLTSVDFNGMEINYHADNIKFFSNALKKNKKINSLEFSLVNFTDEDAKAFSDALKDNKNLLMLRFYKCKITADGFKKIANGLAHNSGLSELNITYNSIDSEGAKVWAKLLEKNQNLLSLGLFFNDIDDEGAKAFAKALKKNKTLNELNLVNNEIGEEGAISFNNALDENKSLLALNLAGNNISKVQQQAILDKVDRNRRRATELLNAAISGDINKVVQLVSEGVAINGQGTNYNTPLHYASAKGHNLIVHYLLTQPQIRRLPNKDGELPVISRHIEALLINDSSIDTSVPINTVVQPVHDNLPHTYNTNLAVSSSVWVKNLDVMYTCPNAIKNESSNEDVEAKTDCQLYIPIPFSYSRKMLDTYRSLLYQKKHEDKQNKNRLPNICAFSLVIGYKVYNYAKEERIKAREKKEGNYYTYYYEFKGSPDIHVSTAYGMNNDNPDNTLFRNDLYKYHVTEQVEIANIAKNPRIFYETFHHSERAMYKYLDDNFTKPLTAFKQELEDKRHEHVNVKVAFMILDVLSTHYQCGWCNKAMQYFQDPNEEFMKGLGEKLKNDKFELPRNGLFFFHRYAAEKPCKGEPLVRKDKHSFVTFDIKQVKKERVNLILKKDSNQIHDKPNPPTLAHSRKTNVGIQWSSALTLLDNNSLFSNSATASSSAETASDESASKRRRKK